MKLTMTLGRVAGIPLRVHASFLLLVAWVALVHWRLEPSVASVIDGVVLLLAVFAIVLLHELSHALTALAFGVRTSDITLWPIGGVSRLERMPEKPHEELLVAIAGPLLNGVLACLCLLLLVQGAPAGQGTAFVARTLTDAASGQRAVPFLAQLFIVNVTLGLFNLLPAFPMDGGRILRGALALFIDRGQATRVAALIGKVMAGGFVLLGLTSGALLLALVGVFVWLGATAEQGSVDLQRAVAGYVVRDALVARAETLAPDEPLARAVRLLLGGFQQEFPVVEQGRLVGYLGFDDLLRGLAERGPDAPVAGVMQRDVPVVHPGDDLFEVMRGDAARRRYMPVVAEDGAYAGMLAADNVVELVRVREALQQKGRRRLATVR